MCEHGILRGRTAVSRCAVHSRQATGVQVWTWAATATTVPCPCGVADRFVVAHESASGGWLSAADVVVATPRDTASVAAAVVDRLGRLPGCLLVFVPLTGGGAVVGGRGECAVLPRTRLCAACVYPWLVRGGDLGRLTTA